MVKQLRSLVFFDEGHKVFMAANLEDVTFVETNFEKARLPGQIIINLPL